jgi:hypothetical protein
VPEWLIGPVSKTGVPLCGTEGSNPSSSADKTESTFMDTGAFERTLRAFQRRRPFQPFMVALVNFQEWVVDIVIAHGGLDQ